MADNNNVVNNQNSQGPVQNNQPTNLQLLRAGWNHLPTWQKWGYGLVAAGVAGIVLAPTISKIVKGKKVVQLETQLEALTHADMSNFTDFEKARLYSQIIHTAKDLDTAATLRDLSSLVKKYQIEAKANLGVFLQQEVQNFDQTAKNVRGFSFKKSYETKLRETAQYADKSVAEGLDAFALETETFAQEPFQTGKQKLLDEEKARTKRDLSGMTHQEQRRELEQRLQLIDDLSKTPEQRFQAQLKRRNWTDAETTIQAVQDIYGQEKAEQLKSNLTGSKLSVRAAMSFYTWNQYKNSREARDLETATKALSNAYKDLEDAMTVDDENISRYMTELGKYQGAEDQFDINNIVTAIRLVYIQSERDMFGNKQTTQEKVEEVLKKLDARSRGFSDAQKAQILNENARWANAYFGLKFKNEYNIAVEKAQDGRTESVAVHLLQAMRTQPEGEQLYQTTIASLNINDQKEKPYEVATKVLEATGAKTWQDYKAGTKPTAQQLTDDEKALQDGSAVEKVMDGLFGTAVRVPYQVGAGLTDLVRAPFSDQVTWKDGVSHLGNAVDSAVDPVRVAKGIAFEVSNNTLGRLPYVGNHIEDGTEFVRDTLPFQDVFASDNSYGRIHSLQPGKGWEWMKQEYGTKGAWTRLVAMVGYDALAAHQIIESTVNDKTTTGTTSSGIQGSSTTTNGVAGK